MNINLAAICDHALVDQQGKLSVIGIFQNIWVAQFPAVHPRLHLVIRLQGKRTEIGPHTIKIQLTDPDGDPVFKGDGGVNFSEPPAGVVDIEASAILVFDVPLKKEGRYQFDITVDDDLETMVPLNVMQSGTTAAPAGSNLN